MKGLALRHHLVGVGVSIGAAHAAVADLEVDNAAKDAQIAALQAENAALAATLVRQGYVDEARWALDHLAWPDGRPITPAEKSAAAAVLAADRIARARDQGGLHA